MNQFMEKIKDYSAPQQKELMRLASLSLDGLLTAFPKPKQTPDADPDKRAEGISDGRMKKLLADLELYLAEKMHQLNTDRDAFLRFDRMNRGYLSPNEFRAACATVNILLSDKELELFLIKYDTVGDGFIRYGEFLKYTAAKRKSQIRSASMESYNQAILNRPIPDPLDIDRAIRDVENSPEVRLEKGFQQCREFIYLKGKNLTAFFKTLAGADTKKVSVNDVIANLDSMGFPGGLVTIDEVSAYLYGRGKENAGYLNQSEFNDLFTMAVASPSTAPIPAAGEQFRMSFDENVVSEVVGKLNSLSLRVVFKSIDLDCDGLINSKELAQSLMDHGLNKTICALPDFMMYLDSFSKRRQGQFGYAEFVYFINNCRTRSPHLQLIGSKQVIDVPDGSSAEEVLNILNATSKTCSVSAHLRNYVDAEGTNTLNEVELLQALQDLNFNISLSTVQTFLDAFDHNAVGRVPVLEIARSIEHPLANWKLKGGVRRAPGGESQVPLGHNLSIDLQAKDKPWNNNRTALAITQPPGGNSSIDFKASPDPQVKSSWTSRVHESNIDFGAAPDSTPIKRGQYQPPGGWSSVNFGEDHGGARPLRTRGNIGGEPSIMLEHNPVKASADAVTAPRQLSKVKDEPITQIGYSQEEVEAHAAARPISHVTSLQPPGGHSVFAFDSSFGHEFKPSLRVTAGPGGNTDINLSHDPYAPILGPRVREPPSYGQASFDQSFNPDRTDGERGGIPKQLMRSLQPTGGVTSIMLEHGPHTSSPGMSKVRSVYAAGSLQSPGGNPSVVLGSNVESTVVSQFDSALGAGVQVDTSLLATICEAVEQAGRIRHTFQDMNRPNCTTLNKTDFQEGMAKHFSINVSADACDNLYSAFNQNHDGELTYSEFVRMIATKRAGDQ